MATESRLPDHYHVQSPELVEESSLQDPIPRQSDDPPPHAKITYQVPVTYQIASTIKGKRKLIDSNG